MDRLRTLLLQRTHTVVMDADRAADAATRPHRDIEVDKLEDELVQRGYVMSLDLAMTIRRLPHPAMQDLRQWLFDRLPRRPTASMRGAYRDRILGCLASSPLQPCPWCGEIKRVGALDPCGHLVCRTCWEGGKFIGCPVCHHRVALEPFLAVPPADGAQRTSTLALLHVAFDLVGTARHRFSGMLSRTQPLGADDRNELEAMIDALGPRVLAWLPARIPVRTTMALAIARLWLVSPDRTGVVAATSPHLETATDLLRVATVVMGGNPALVEPIRLRSISRRLRRSVLEVLDRMPTEQIAEDLARHAQLWRRIGERLHPGEHAERLPNAALAFAIARGSAMDDTTRARAAAIPSLRVDGARLHVRAWAGPVEEALHRGDAIAALGRCEQRPAQLLLRVDHLLRVAQQRQPEALPAIIDGLARAAAHGAAGRLVVLAAHIARRGAPWQRRVLGTWICDDERPPLRPDVIAEISRALRSELVARAGRRRNFPRAVIHRALGDQLIPPRGSELAVTSPLVLEATAELAGVCFDAAWRHVATIDPARIEIDPYFERGIRCIVVVSRARGVLRVAGLELEMRPRSVPIAIDLADRRVIRIEAPLRDVTSYRAQLAHLARDTRDLVAPGARPSVWDVACVHAATRANIVYIHERDGAITTYRRRDGEGPVARLLRVLSGADHDGVVSAIPATEAPTFHAVGDLVADLDAAR